MINSVGDLDVQPSFAIAPAPVFACGAGRDAADRRDTPPTSAEQFLLDLNEKLKGWPGVRIVTVSGRYYAMDRDKRWDRVEKAYRCLTEGIGRGADSALEAVRQSYQDNITDEFLLPTVIRDAATDGLVRDGDRRYFL